jgi:NAD(P)-dependent dehydrogenase (short-subunit alcohol dehydrogenase family)
VRLSDKKVVVVGGAGRIGKELCVRLLQEGSKIVVADIDLGAWESYAKEKLSKDLSSRCKQTVVDATSTTSVRALVAFAEAELGGLDAMINCSYPRAAGLNKRVEDLSIEEFSENLHVHLGSYFLVSKEFALALKKRGSGSIVNFSSVYGVMVPRFQVYEGTSMVQPITYAAIKAGIVHSSKYLAKYLKDSGVRVNCVSPGGILDQQPESFRERYADFSLSKGMLDPADVLGAVVYLVSDDSRFFNGQNLVIDDGFSL